MQVPDRFNPHEGGVVLDIAQALTGLLHGEITITVRSGQVIQIERVARTRPQTR